MIPAPDADRLKARLVVWWIIWASVLCGLIIFYFVLAGNKSLPPPATKELFTNLAGLLPLFLSVIIRWLVLPRGRNPSGALAMFIIGLALAEGCGLLGILLGGGYRDMFFVLGILGILQYVPFFAKRLFEPRMIGFMPNN